MQVLRHLAALDEVEDVVRAHDVGLALLDAEKLDSSATRTSLCRSPFTNAGPRLCDELVEERLVEERLGREERRAATSRGSLGEGPHDAVELGLDEVPEEHLLGALLLSHHLVVRQVEGDGLDALARLAARVDEVHDADRAVAAALAVGAFGDGEVPLHRRQEHLVAGELRRRGRVADRDVRLEGRLEAEQIVLVRLVGADGRLDARVEVHPVLVALAVLVAAEGRRARDQELRERLVGVAAAASRSCAAAGFSHSAYAFDVRDGLELLGVALHHGGEALERVLPVGCERRRP